MKSGLIIEKIDNMFITLRGDAFKPISHQKSFYLNANRLLRYVMTHKENQSSNAQRYEKLKNKYDSLVKWYGTHGKIKTGKNSRQNTNLTITPVITGVIPRANPNRQEVNRKQEEINGRKKNNGQVC